MSTCVERKALCIRHCGQHKSANLVLCMHQVSEGAFHMPFTGPTLFCKLRSSKVLTSLCSLATHCRRRASAAAQPAVPGAGREAGAPGRDQEGRGAAAGAGGAGGRDAERAAQGGRDARQDGGLLEGPDRPVQRPHRRGEAPHGKLNSSCPCVESSSPGALPFSPSAQSEMGAHCAGGGRLASARLPALLCAVLTLSSPSSHGGCSSRHAPARRTRSAAGSSRRWRRGGRW